jgi:hydrogenase nickel incorporation protein HypA/HybF
MHEWALAESIVMAAVEEARKEKLKSITQVIVFIGELQQIEKEIFQFALNELSKSQKPPIKKDAFVLKTEKGTLACKTCGNTWKFSDMKKSLDVTESESIHFIPEVVFVHARCPKCGSPDFEIMKGRGVVLSSITGVR